MHDKANVLCSNYLEDYLKEQGHNDTKIFSVSPGMVLTNLGRFSYAKWGVVQKALAILFYPLIMFLLRSPLQGAQTSIYCAVEPGLQSGFYRNCQKTELLSHARNKENEKKLWLLSEDLVKKWIH